VIGNSELFDCGNSAAAQVLGKRNALLARKRADLLRRRRFDKTAHEKIAAMNFQYHSGRGTDGLGIIIQRCFVGRADFAQFCARGFDYFADAKSAADLHELAARDNHLRRALATASRLRSRPAILFCEMVNDQD
jgi:hypothetical protein